MDAARGGSVLDLVRARCARFPIHRFPIAYEEAMVEEEASVDLVGKEQGAAPGMERGDATFRR